MYQRGEGIGIEEITHPPAITSHRFVRRGSATLIQRSASSWPRRSSDSAWMLVPGASWGFPYVDLGDEFGGQKCQFVS